MKEVQNIIFEELEDLRKRIISNIDSTGRRASGRTSGSMHTDVSENHHILHPQNSVSMVLLLLLPFFISPSIYHNVLSLYCVAFCCIYYVMKEVYKK